MGDAVQKEFLRRIRVETPNTGLRYVAEHFWLRGLLSGAIESPSTVSSKSRSKDGKGLATKPSKKKLADALVAGQLNVKHLIEVTWDSAVFRAGMASCARTWLNQMVAVS